MNYLKYYLPVSYTIYSRIDSKQHLISWLYLFPGFCFLVYLAFGDWSNLAIFPVAFLSSISIYEIGYIFNDIRSVRGEKSPTIRVKDSWFIENILKLIFSRVLFFLVCMAFLFFTLDLTDFLVYTASSIFLAFCFFLHNKLRGPINSLTFFLLSSAKYLSTVFFFINDYSLVAIVVILFPLLRTVEYSSIKGYIPSLDFISKDLNLFRLLYYFVVLCSYLVGWFFLDFASDYLLLIVYFFFLRLSVYLVKSKSALLRRA